jgi:dynein heavy chain, axonemal
MQPLDSFIGKIVQLYEMIVVRHGLMLVGAPFGMKTSAINVLSAALGIMQQKGLEHRCRIWSLNPKSVSLGQLYGSRQQAK